MAKYFTIQELGGGDGPFFSSVRALRAQLETMPEVQTVQRWWWSGDDLVDCEDVPRDEIMKTKAKKLKAGITAQWGHDHGY